MSISRLQQPLGIAPDDASFAHLHHLSTSLILIILFGIAALASLCIYLLRSRFSIERSVEVQSKGQAQLKRNVVERLSGVHSAMENVSKTISEIRSEAGPGITTTSAPPFPSGCGSEGNKGSTTIENIVEKGKTGHQASLLTSQSTNEVSRTDNNEQDFAKIAVKMSELVELSQRLQIATRTFDRYKSAPPPKINNVDSSAQTRRYLPFFLGDEVFAVSLHTVKEVIEAKRLIIASARPWRTRRAINLRGSVVPVIDLSEHLGGKPTEVNQSTLIIMLVVSRGERAEMIGVKVDAICNILSITLSSIESPLIQKADIRSGFTIGTLRADNRSITVLDIDRGLSMGIFPELNFASRVQE